MAHLSPFPEAQCLEEGAIDKSLYQLLWGNFTGSRQHNNCSERSWWDCLGVGIVQIGQEEKYIPEGPQVREKGGPEVSKRGRQEEVMGAWKSLQSWRKWLSDTSNQDQSVAHCAVGGQLGIKEEVTRGERSISGYKNQEAGLGQVPSPRRSLSQKG